MKDVNPIISVIVPVYNAEKYLRRCIDSILAQTFTDFELLLIDDGSKDRSGEICDGYARKDKRVKVFHKENGGVSSARNLGLDNARGEWICFCDSDDIVTQTYLSDMIGAVNEESQFVLSNYRRIDAKGSVINLDYIVLEDADMVRYFIDKKVFALSAPYAKLYKTDVISEYHIRFPLGIQMGEDAIFIMRYLNKITSVNVVDKCNYIVNQTEGSLSSKYYPFEKEWDCYVIWKRELLTFLTRFGKIYDDPVKIAWENRISDTFNRCLQCLYRQSEKLSFKRKLRYLQSIPKEDLKEYKHYYKPLKLRRKILKLLVEKRLFGLYIFMGLFDNFKS